jgi:SAM-dependent methyltransferase
MKNIAKGTIRTFLIVFRLVPRSVWVYLSKIGLRVITFSNKPANALKIILSIENVLYETISKAACEYSHNIHPKHRLTNYHDFFIRKLKKKDTVLDIGCGNGALAFDIAQSIDVYITGIDMNKDSIAVADKKHCHSNVKYINGDVLKELPNKKFDVIIMSNVLEHIERRAEFLRSVQKSNMPKRWLIRVPLFERDWRVPLKKELGIDYRLDPTHYIEYTQEQFYKELHSARLRVINKQVRWGEIWCEAEPIV